VNNLQVFTTVADQLELASHLPSLFTICLSVCRSIYLSNLFKFIPQIMF